MTKEKKIAEILDLICKTGNILIVDCNDYDDDFKVPKDRVVSPKYIAKRLAKCDLEQLVIIMTPEEKERFEELEKTVDSLCWLVNELWIKQSPDLDDSKKT